MECERILAIDPGTEMSGYVFMRRDLKVLGHGIVSNELLIDQSSRHVIDTVVIEMVASYGMPVGRSTFDTVVWIGRFVEFYKSMCCDVILQTRKDICSTVSHRGAKDGVISQAMRDLYPATGGGKTPQVGTKKQPGPLYGFKSHIYQALAVGVAYVQDCQAYRLSCEGDVI